MAESSTLKNVSLIVTIVGGVVATTIAVAQFLDRGGGDHGNPSEMPSATISADAGSGCGFDAPAEVTLSDGQAPRTSQVTVYGSCFQPGERVVIRVHATEVGSATADSKGSFTQRITIPESAPPAGFPTEISATGKKSVKTGSAPFQTD